MPAQDFFKILFQMMKPGDNVIDFEKVGRAAWFCFKTPI